jgi:hypothetical protein
VKYPNPRDVRERERERERRKKEGPLQVGFGYFTLN